LGMATGGLGAGVVWSSGPGAESTVAGRIAVVFNAAL
jgi:hypothetical protein